MRRLFFPCLAFSLMTVTTAAAFEVKIPSKTSLKASVITTDTGTPLFDTTPGKVEVTNLPGVQAVQVENFPSSQAVEVTNLPATQAVDVQNFPAVQAVQVTNFPSNAGSGLTFNRVVLISSESGTVTVPADTVWQITAVNGGAGVFEESEPIGSNCGYTCGGGSCNESSCTFQAFIWELNGTPIGERRGCAACAGGACAPPPSPSPNCPASISFPFSDDASAVVHTPFWLAAGSTVKVNPTNTFMSVVEYLAPSP